MNAIRYELFKQAKMSVFNAQKNRSLYSCCSLILTVTLESETRKNLSKVPPAPSAA